MGSTQRDCAAHSTVSEGKEDGKLEVLRCRRWLQLNRIKDRQPGLAVRKHHACIAVQYSTAMHCIAAGPTLGEIHFAEARPAAAGSRQNALIRGMPIG